MDNTSPVCGGSYEKAEAIKEKDGTLEVTEAGVQSKTVKETIVDRKIIDPRRDEAIPEDFGDELPPGYYAIPQVGKHEKRRAVCNRSKMD